MSDSPSDSPSRSRSDVSSDAVAGLDPAIGLLEFDSIVAGMVAGDAMVKASPVSSLYAGTVHPGRYLVLVGGETAAVEVALESAGTDTVIDSLFLADVHPAVIAAITTPAVAAPVDGDALAIVETSSVATAIAAGDAGVKAAAVSLPALRVADELGGKSYCLLAGPLADVEAALERAIQATEHRGTVLRSAVIPQLHPEMRDNLVAELRFNGRLRPGGGGV